MPALALIGGIVVAGLIALGIYAIITSHIPAKSRKRR